MLSRCTRLERLSIKNTTWSTYLGTEQWPVPQEMIMKMVRRNRNLRWLRSHLTEENIAILQQERPDVTFVAE